MSKNISILLALFVLGLAWMVSGPDETPELQSAPVATASLTDGSALVVTYKAKRNASEFAHLFKMAKMNGCEELRSNLTPKDAIHALVGGVTHPSGLIYRMSPLTESEIHDALVYLEEKEGTIALTESGKLNAIEREIRLRETSCANGACGECVSGIVSNITTENF
jgi:hypothetical protein